MPTTNDMAFYSEEMERERGEIVDSLKQELAQLTLMLESSGVYAEAVDPRLIILMEHIDINCSEFNSLQFMSICSLRIPSISRNKTIFSTGQFMHHQQQLATPICESDMRLGALEQFSVKVLLI